MQEAFQQADTDFDGLLNRAEFSNLLEKLAQQHQANGIPSQITVMTDDQKDDYYGYLNSLSFENEGIDISDFVRAHIIIKGQIQAKRQQQ